MDSVPGVLSRSYRVSASAGSTSGLRSQGVGAVRFLYHPVSLAQELIGLSCLDKRVHKAGGLSVKLY